MLGNYLKPFVKRVIDTEQDDFRKIILLQLAIFMIISVLMILKPLGTSLMLSTYGIDIIPIAFVGIAVAAICIHFGLILLRRFFSLNRAISINFVFHILIIIGIAAAINFNLLYGWTTVAVYVYISLFSVITVTLFFQYCQSLLSIRDAKRVLSHVGVGAIAGGVFGGYFASATVSYFGNIGLLFSAVAFLIIAALSLRRVHLEFGTDLVDDTTESDWIGGQFFRTLKNKHVIYIVGIICFGVISSKLLDYLFNAVASAHFDDQGALTAFFGFWFSSINVIGLLIQLFLVNPLIDRLGVTYSMSIMPFMILLSLMAFIYMPILAVGIIMKMVDGSMKQSIYKTSTEINIMPLSSAIRERAKSLIDVVVDSIATGLSGVLIYILINKVSLPLWVITITTILVVIVWLIFIFLSRRTYLRQLAQLVYSDDSEDEELDASPKEYIEHLLKEYGRKSIKRFMKLTELTKQAQTPVKFAAIEIIGEEYSKAGLSNLVHLKKDNSYLVRKKYFEEKLKYIKTRSELNSLYLATKPNNKIILTGALARSIGYRPKQLKRYQVYERIDENYTYLNQNDVSPRLWRTWMTAVAHSRDVKYYPMIKEQLMDSANNDMKMFALFAVMRGKVAPLFQDVVNCKVSIGDRKRWYKALATFPKLLLRHLNSIPLTDSKQLKRLIPALKRIDKQAHLNFLFSILEHPKKGVRIEALKTIGVLKLDYPYLNFKRRKNRARLFRVIKQIKEILREISQLNELKEKNSILSQSPNTINEAISILKNELDAYVHVLFVLLGLVIDSNDMMKSYYGMIRGNEQATLDYLDQLLPYRLKLRILPLLKMAAFDKREKSLTSVDRATFKNMKFKAPHLYRLNSSLHDELKKILKEK